MLRATLAIALLALGAADFPMAAAPGYAFPEYIRSEYRNRVSAWLAHHADYRIALDVDCDCAEEIAELRKGGGAWPPNPKYHPYFVVGDFAETGAVDLAIGVVEQSAPHDFRVLVLHGVNADGGKRTDFVSAPFPMRGMGLFYGKPRPKPWRLLVGAFRSEGAAFLPDGAGYTLDNSEDE